MLTLKDAHRNEPIYLCATHATEVGGSTTVRRAGNKSPESAPVRISSMGPAANVHRDVNARPGRRNLYILLLVAGLALAGGLLGPRLFRRTPSRSQKTAAIAAAKKKTGSTTLPRKAPREVQVEAPQGRSQAVLHSRTQSNKPSHQTADVTVKGTIARQVLPDVLKSASNTIRGTILVSVKVRVDALGNVEKTDLVVPGPSRYFARLAVEAARHWKFNPPAVAGQNSQSQWLIRFYYTRTATRAFATEDTQGVRAGKPSE